MTRLHLALQQIELVRDYTNELLRHIHIDDWFRMPHEGVTHVGWQVGHLAVSEYKLLLTHLRGEREADASVISETFLTSFGKSSIPTKDSRVYPSPADIVGVFDRIHEQALAELQLLHEDELDQPLTAPNPHLKTKYDAISWMAQHEMLHAGQIGLLRRLFGQPPLR